MTDQNRAIEVTVYTRPSCARTETACQMLEDARQRFALRTEMVDVTFDVTLEIAYGQDTPVVLIEGVERFRREVNPHELNIILQTIHMKKQQERRRRRRG